ncbi:DUF3472 domain-containing protein [Tenacibaculum xiamenense]|uniref:DUF3472 domain-containing protein n=1 Tax=Tenacibaculum xiamenense TaxID=1261553 RepID=UPI0038945795
MKTLFLLSILFLLNTVVVSQSSGPSIHANLNDNGSGDIIMKTTKVTNTGPTSYFSTMGWNQGSEGGGYCGIQDSPDKGHAFIFSIWDPSNRQPIRAKFTGSGTNVERFGGEGTGLKSFNRSIGWSLNEWITTVARKWNVGNHTYFGFWIRRNNTNQWHHMVTMDYPVANVNFNSKTNAFVEDWTNKGNYVRGVQFKDVFKRINGQWTAPNSISFYKVTEPRSAQYSNNVDAGVINNGTTFYMKAGGGIFPNSSLDLNNLPKSFNLSTPNTEPATPSINFSISSASTSSVTWNVPTSSTPQFKYTIKVNGAIVASAINPETRSSNITVNENQRVEVVLEDILGRTVTKSAIVKNPQFSDGVYKITFENSGKSLDAFGTSNGANIGLWGYHGGTNQQWRITYVKNSNTGLPLYSITNVRSNKVADGFGTSNGANIGLYQHHGGSNQLWILEKFSNNVYHVINSRSKLCVNANGANNGDNITQNYCNGSTNQQLRLVKLSNRSAVNETVKRPSLQNDTSEFTIFPNPASEILNISISENDKADGLIEIFDIQGKKVMAKSIKTKEKNRSQIDVSNLVKGLYILKYYTSDRKYIKKIIIQ